MEDGLPSYEAAVTKDYWPLVGEYVQSKDLCSVALVSKRLNKIFTSYLWGNPASHFNAQDDAVYVALTRFKRTLSWARLTTRELTHTVHLPPAHAELYEGPHADWLRDILERLPRLQSLIVDQLPFFDHGCLVALRYPSALRRPVSLSTSTSPQYALRLLDASSCYNATPTGLAEALKHFPALLSLNLSATLAAKDSAVLSALRFLPYLQVLKLKGLALKDEDIKIVAKAVQQRVRSLDIRCNALTDASVRILLGYCIKAMPDRADFEATVNAQDDWPSGLRPHLGANILDGYRGENLDKQIRSLLTRGVASRLAIEDAAGTGITHLYISDNNLSVEGVSGLIRSGRLHVLDVGSMPEERMFNTMPSSIGGLLGLPHLPGDEKLTPLLAERASQNLTYLRINHAVVTKDAPAVSASQGRTELEANPSVQRVADPRGLDCDLSPFELGGHPIYQELSSDQDSRFELEGSCVQTPQRPTTAAKELDVKTANLAQVRRGSIYAPEVVESLALEESASNPALREAVRSSQIFTNVDSSLTAAKPSSCTYASVVEDRRARRQILPSQIRRLQPAILPQLRTLVLTDVPRHTSSSQIAHHLIGFVNECAEESRLAKLQASLGYDLPPGRNRKAAERDYARSLFALQRIVLEMAPDSHPAKHPTTTWHSEPTMSSTGDADTEAFWKAARYDFSFFADEECGQPGRDAQQSLPLAAMSEKIVVTTDQPQPPDWGLEPAPPPRVDVIGELSAYRKARKAAYETAERYGEPISTVEGYWEGEVSVIRSRGGE